MGLRVVADFMALAGALLLGMPLIWTALKNLWHGVMHMDELVAMAVGAAMGALAGHFSDYGIDDDFVKSVRDQVTEGTSALFLLTVTGSAAVDKLQDELKGKMGILIKSNLTNEQEAKLNEAFGEE